jgi:hypothetical protein
LLLTVFSAATAYDDYGLPTTVYRTHDQSLADLIAEGLSGYLGPHMARNAVKTFANKALGRPPEMLVRSDVEPLLRALRPMLRTLLGAQQAETVIEHLTKEASL